MKSGQKTNICKVKYNTTIPYQNFIQCDMMFHETFKSNIDRSRWFCSALQPSSLRHHTALNDVLCTISYSQFIYTDNITGRN